MRQKLGQHFLKNREKLLKIVEALDLSRNSFVVEVGPGHGELTWEIRNQNPEVKILAIEKDKALALPLKQKFFSDKNIEIMEGDALDIIPALNIEYDIRFVNYKLAGNIPYYITGHLLRIIEELKNKPKLSVFLIQKEVAERICAIPPKMNLLAASVQFWAEPKIITTVPKKDFNPPPEVDSAVILLETKSLINTGNEPVNADKYYKFIKRAFKQPRKTLYNNLIDGGFEKKKILEIFEQKSIDPKIRPQNSDIRELKELSLLF